MHASDNVCVCLKKKCQQTAFITPTPSSFTPPPPWNYEATNRATSPNPPNSRTSAGELYFNLIWHVSGTAKNRGKNLVQRGFDLKTSKYTPFFVLGHFIWLQFLHFLSRIFGFGKKNVADLQCTVCMRCECVAVCFYMCVCVLGLRQNRAAEMRQALQIFVGWLTAPCRCQAPTAETTKRRIRLALEPQIFSPPPSLLLFSPCLFSLRGTAFTLVGVWLDLATFTSTHEFINLSLFRSDLMGEGSRKHGT